MYFIPYLFNHVYIFIGYIDFSSWLGLACIVLFLILTVHSYVAPTLNKFIYLLFIIIIYGVFGAQIQMPFIFMTSCIRMQKLFKSV